MTQITVMAASIRKTECTPLQEKVLHFQHERNYNFTGLLKVYVEATLQVLLVDWKTA